MEVTEEGKGIEGNSLCAIALANLHLESQNH